MAMFEQEHARWDALNQALHEALQANPQVRSAWLYGSVARGEDTPHSDIDIAIVTQDDGPGVADAVREALQALEERWDVHLSVVVLAPSDVARLQPNDRWWLEMTKDAKLLKGVGPQQEALRCARAVHPA
jgi:predicted nucleotidyltransferase